MSGLLLRESNCAENEFLAEETLIEIIPNFDHPAFHFISGTFGPFETSVLIQVPLWFAISLNQKQKCKINIPEWLSVAFLEQKVLEERSSAIFGDVPFHYVEIAVMLFESVAGDIEDLDLVKSLVQDLEKLRMDRIKLGLHHLAGTVKEHSTNGIKLTNISAMEVHSIRRFITESFDLFALVDPGSQAENGVGGYNDGSDARQKISRFR